MNYIVCCYTLENINILYEEDEKWMSKPKEN